MSAPDHVVLTVEANETATESWWTVVPFPGKWMLSAAAFVPDDTLATDGTNYITLTIRDAANGANVASTTTNSSGGAALTAGTATVFTLSGNLEYTGQTGEIKLINTVAAGTPALIGRWVLGMTRMHGG